MVRTLRSITLWTFAVAITAMAGVSAQQAAPAGLPAATPQQAPTIDTYVVGQAKPPETPGTQMMDLTLEQAMQRALDKNIDLQVARVNPLIQDYNLVTARAAFKPTLSASFNQNRSSSVTTSALDNVGTTLTNSSQAYNGALNQLLPWYGAQLGLSFSNGRSASNSLNNLRNPSYSSQVRANYSMPLLANFRIDNQRNALRTQTVQRQISDLQLQSTIENTKSQVRQGYWNLKASIEAIEIQKRSLDLARRSLADTNIRVEIGTLAPIDAVNFETQVASAEQQLLAAQIAWTTQELSFKRLIVSGPDDELYKMTINPLDGPGFGEQKVDITAAVQTALANRTDIDIARKNLQVSAVEPGSDEEQHPAGPQSPGQLHAERHGRPAVRAEPADEHPHPAGGRQLLRRVSRHRLVRHAGVDHGPHVQLPARHGLGQSRARARRADDATAADEPQVDRAQHQHAGHAGGLERAEHLSAVHGGAQDP